MYTPIAIRYRPAKFSEVVGQEVTKRILSNSILMNRVISSMLISGFKGSGKTTLARLYGGALNCQNFSGDLCGVCDSCKSLLDQNHPDIFEFDAASNNGVDFVRGLEDVVTCVPFYKRRVFIFDEAHMFTPQAQAALLKLLEECPAVTFMFVTTDVSRLEKTLTSRCLSMPLQSLKTVDIEKSLRYVLSKEKVEYTDDFVVGLASIGVNLSLRDTQQILDQAITMYGGQILTGECLDSFDVISSRQYSILAGMLCSRNLPHCLASIESLYGDGFDLKKLFLEGVPNFLRDCSFFLNGLTGGFSYLTGLSVELFRNKLTLDLASVKLLFKSWETLEPMMRETDDPRSIWSLFCVDISGVA